MQRRRVVVTGLGTVNPLAHNVDDFWAALLEGRSGAAPITLFDSSRLDVKFAAEVKDFDSTAYLPRKEARRFDRSTMLFWAATQQAVADAGISYEDGEPGAERAGVVCGTGIGGIGTTQDQMDVLAERGPSRVSPLAIPMIMSNQAAGAVSIGFHLAGPSTCTVTACAASANAIGDAAEIIRRGVADVMVAGGMEGSVTEFAMAGFNSMKALSTRNEDPTAASRPFDRDRDGFLLGEGAGALILEEYEHARERGADIYGEFVGYGMSADAYHITLPRPGGGGAARAMQAALDDAGVDPVDVDYINAHGTSTPANDVTETLAIKSVFGDHARSLAVSSTKSMTGHMLGGAGAVEAVIALKTVSEGVIPPTINYTTPDPECDLDYVPNEPREAPVSTALSNSFGFGGHNVSLLFRSLRATT
ncbi:MAG: beta-ketoacyl-ACP synthase II [Acidimicrobiia bacterium]|nr:beta-ketoacyl-ACP synthase II [Acidimicrobiia bacterium]